MSFRLKMFVLFPLVVVAAVAIVGVGVTSITRRSFEQLDTSHTDAIVSQFQREFVNRGQQIARGVQDISGSEATLNMAIHLSARDIDPSLYGHDAVSVASDHHFDFLEFAGNDGSIISSMQWPARFGYKEDWLLQQADWRARGAFLQKVDTPDGPELGLIAVSILPVAGSNLYTAGGERLDKSFLSSLSLPQGMRALLYVNLGADFSPQNLTAVDGPITQPERFAPLVARELQQPGEITTMIHWTRNAASDEVFHLLPLRGPGRDLLGILFVGSSRHDLVLLERSIRRLALLVGGIALALGILLSWWAAVRVTWPVGKLVAGAEEVASGNWDARVAIHSHDEIGALAGAFNQMTGQLAEQRERLIQTERVAAWRELARRLAHELKNPLFPLQITVENLQRAREQSTADFDEIFRESTGTLLAEIQNLKKIVGRFSDFAKMPHPELQPLDVNEMVRGVTRLFEPRFIAPGEPKITTELYLDEKLPVIQADSTLLHRAIGNLVLNAIDAMPDGGKLTLRTMTHGDGVRLEISDTGAGLTREECERLFTPYYTTKQHGTGLGLAIVQSVVSDHGGRISVASEPGRGTTFRIDLPEHPPDVTVVEPIPIDSKKSAEPVMGRKA
ncbi:MAG TPA: ATP-binding protein [Candidatus Acidoferrales bacterium]|nr:ATP-binding protein [Candidatus Acidoferrales bacterium]